MSTVLSRGTAALVATTLAAALALTGAPAAHAATDVTVPVSADPTGSEVVDGTLLYNDAKGNTASTGYQIGYRGNLDMRPVWTQYRTLKTLYKVFGGHTEEEWDRLSLRGSFTIEFTPDPDYVSFNPSFLTVAGLQQQYEAQNAGTAFPSYMRVTSVTQDAATGRYLASYALIDGPGGSAENGVSAEKIDEAQPASLSLTTPDQALYVKQSDFTPGRQVVMTNPKVEGSITVFPLFIQQLPVNFTGTGGPVTLTMVDTYVSTFRYTSGTAGTELPASLAATAPPARPNLPTGTEVTPPAPDEPVVETDAGTWTFQGWEPASATVAEDDLEFVGTWTFVAAPQPTPTDTPTSTGTPTSTPTSTPTGTPTSTGSPTGTPSEPTEIPPSTHTLDPEPTTHTPGAPVPPHGGTPLPDTGASSSALTWTVLGLLSLAGGVLAVSLRGRGRGRHA